MLGQVPALIAGARTSGVPEGLTWDLLLDALRVFFKVQLFVLARRAPAEASDNDDDDEKEAAAAAAMADVVIGGEGDAADAVCALQPWVVQLLTAPGAPSASQRKRKVGV